MPEDNTLPGTLLKFLACRPGARLQPIRSEASLRRFYRISHGRKKLVAMVYPEPARAEVERFRSIQALYCRHGLRVPAIESILGDQVVIQEDAGDLLLQKAWRSGSERQWLLDKCRNILHLLAEVPAALATARLDQARLKWEMDFFLAHYFSRYPVRGCTEEGLRAALMALVGQLGPECVFAHRDFHSRNLLVQKGEIIMVDFQDSLIAPRYYDLVSLAFDSYLELGMARGRLFSNLVACIDDRELQQVRLTALQRNIKALGTFAYQVHERKHATYGKYIPRTLRHIQGHLRVLHDPEFAVLNKYFNTLNK